MNQLDLPPVFDEEAWKRADTGIVRGREQLATFVVAMAHELESNQYKGDPADTAALDHVRELLYHAMKLYMAVLWGHRPGVLEYAADCGNHAWMAAHAAGCLDLDLLTAGIEGGDGSTGLYETEDAQAAVDELARTALKNLGKAADPGQMTVEQERMLREAPWTFPERMGGFYEGLKGHATVAAGELRSLPRRERQAQSYRYAWRVPSDEMALGHQPRKETP
jgi:hypothetical protein